MTKPAFLGGPRVRFGVFDLDVQSGELHKSGHRVSLRPQASRILIMLVGRPGQLVTREELQEKIWGSNTFVDFENGLNFSIRQIRAALNDDADTPRYVETLPRRGYRFIAPVDAGVHAQPESPDASTSGLEIQSQAKNHAQWQSLLAVTVLLSGFAMLLAPGIFRRRGAARIPVDPSSWVQITSFPDSVSQPALSPDGRILAFVRGPYTFAGPGQIYIKMLPDGEPVQLTKDNSQKMSPVFSLDGSRIAYTTVDSNAEWDTWVVPVLGGQPHPWLANASGLVWLGRKTLFSQVKENKIHMAVVTADESGEQHDVYIPASDRGMAHRSFPSPDGKWAIVVEMDRALWLPCKLVSLDGSAPARPVGPATGACTFAAWSPSGEWMYFTSGASSSFHLWRQRFPNGTPEQITSGISEEEGIAIAPDGHSLITAVGSRQSSIWLHDVTGERQISLEGFSFDPKFTPDGKRLCYRILRGALRTTGPTEMRVVDLDSGRGQVLLPELSVAGIPGHTYDFAADGRQIVVGAIDRNGKHRLWIASLDGRPPLRPIPDIEGYDPVFGHSGQIFFRAIEGGSAFAYEVHTDGTGLRKVLNQPIALLGGVSPDGQWLVAKLAGAEGSSTAAISLRQRSVVRLIASGGFNLNDIQVSWSRDGKELYITVQKTEEPGASGRTYAIPLLRGQMLPEIPAGGFQSEEEILKLRGASVLNDFDCPGPAPETYAFARETTQRNLFRVPLP